MRIYWTAAFMVGLIAGALGCSGYSSLNNPQAPQDSTGDSTPPPPGYSRN